MEGVEALPERKPLWFNQICYICELRKISWLTICFRGKNYEEITFHIIISSCTAYPKRCDQDGSG
jgi:hypothetical protein